MTKSLDLLHFFYEYKKRLLIGFTSVIAGIAILIIHFQSGPSPIHYAEAESAVSLWKNAPEDSRLFESMKEAIRFTPSIGEKYRASIAQELLNVGKIEEALTMGAISLQKVKKEVPFHVTYAESSLLIEQGRLQEALEEAVALKEKMGEDFSRKRQGGSLLYLHNLLRIAYLQEALQNFPGEKAAWDDFQAVLEKNSEIASIFLKGFLDQDMDLSEYIKERQKTLAQICHR